MLALTRACLLCVLWLVGTTPASALIGAQSDSEQRYPFVVALGIGDGRWCTATKIAPRALLTAAHCVVDIPSGALVPETQPGGTLQLTTDAGAHPITVERTWLLPAFADALQRLHRYQQARIAEYRARYSGEELERRIRRVHADSRISDRFPDAAIIALREDTPGIPIAPLNLDPPAAETPVVLVGHGCRGLRELRAGAGPWPRTWGESRIIRADAVNFYTYAAELRPGSVSLCPGDSGGPVLAEGAVIGVHGTVWGLNTRTGARSNMSVNLSTLADWDAWDAVGARSAGF